MQKIKDFIYVAGLMLGVFLVFAGWILCSLATVVAGIFSYVITAYVGITTERRKNGNI